MAMNTPQRTTPVPRTGRHVRTVPPASRNSKTRSFLSLSDSLNAQNDDFSIAREAIDGLMTLLGARAGLVFLPSPVDVLYVKQGSHSPALERFAAKVQSDAADVFKQCESETPRRILAIDRLLVVPLMWQGNVLGLVAFDRFGRMPAAQDEAVLLSLCNQLAAIIGLRNRPAHQQRAPVSDDEMASAAAMQQNLLPSIPPSLSCGLSIATHTHSAGIVGGDYFDLILIDQKKMGMVIADVEGKGIPAALFGNMLRTTVHFLTRESPSTSSVMAKINTILHNEAVALQKLFTMFYAVYNPADRTLTYTGSGHVSPILVRGNGDRVERLQSDGTLIGVHPVQRFHERSVLLEPDDIVLFFTDGLTDYRSETDGSFGEERLADFISRHRHEDAETIVNMLLDELAAFTRQPPPDDWTVIVAKVLP